MDGKDLDRKSIWKKRKEKRKEKKEEKRNKREEKDENKRRDEDGQRGGNGRGRHILCRFLLCGAAVSILCSVLFVIVFRFLSASLPQERGMFSSDVSDQQAGVAWLGANNYILYRELYNQEHGTSYSYEELYLSGLYERMGELQRELEAVPGQNGAEGGEAQEDEEGQSRADQNEIEQDGNGQNGTGQVGAEESEAQENAEGQNGTNQSGADQDGSVQSETEQGGSGPNGTESDNRILETADAPELSGTTTELSPVYVGAEEELDILSSLTAQLWNYFTDLANGYPALSRCFDYQIEDLQTGARIDHAVHSGEKPLFADPDAYAFLLSFVYDANGNVRVEQALVDEQIDMALEDLVSLAYDSVLYNRIQYYLSEYTGYYSFRRYVSETAPQNCRITYGLPRDTWEEMQQNVRYLAVYDNGNSSFGNVLLWENFPQYSAYRIGEHGGYLLLCLLLLLAFLLAALLSGPGGNGTWESPRIFHLPLEVLWIPVICLLILQDGILQFEVVTENGLLAQMLRDAFPSMPPDLGNFSEFLLHYLGLLLYFLAAWYIGLCFRDIRALGMGRYLRERSLIVRLSAWILRRCRGVYEELRQIDLTRDARRLICRVLLVNALILFGISCLWFGGLALVIVYSAVLYILLKKYVGDIQKKYGLLLSATNRIAEGDLHVTVTEDLGVFEPFKPQIYRIQEGFRKAVEEETKSQRMKAELITNVSHDLKTPLTAIITYVDLLKDESLTAEKRREYLETLEQKSLRLKSLIEDLFEVSKAHSQTMPLHLVEVDLGNLLKQTAFEVEGSMREARLELRMSLSEEKILCLLDSQRTYRIFENLFVNVCKYAMPGTRVYAECRGFAEDAEVILKNIAQDELTVSPEELTERFVRGDASRGTAGNGLGLAIAKSFAELQGGSLRVEVDGDLFKVTVRFPRMREERQTGVPQGTS